LPGNTWSLIVLGVFALVCLPTAGARAEDDKWQHPVIQAVKAERALRSEMCDVPPGEPRRLGPGGLR